MFLNAATHQCSYLMESDEEVLRLELKTDSGSLSREAYGPE